MTLSYLFMIVAIVLLFLAALGVAAGRVSLGWLGMAFWGLSLVIRA